jgi:hypothetical protein
MKNRPLIIDDFQRKLIKRCVEHAEKNMVTTRQLLRTLSGAIPPVGDDPKFVVEIPFGYRCVFSIEEQTPGRMRHLSVSVPVPDHCPNGHAVEALMAEFGFRGGIKDAYCVWLENAPDATHKAVNVLQLYEPKK